MPAQPLSDELAQEAATLKLSGLTTRQCAVQAACAKSTMQSRLKIAALRGFLLTHTPAMPGFRIASVSTAPDGKQHIQQKPEHGEAFAVPAGHIVKGESALVDEDGRVIQKWIKTKEGVLDPLQVAEWLKASYADFEPAALPAPCPSAHAPDLLTLLPANDWHVNLSVWGRQTGTSWDLKIAEPTIGNAAVDTIERSPASAECIILGGGDLLHINGKTNTTVNGTPQDTDNRYQKGVEVINRLMVRVTDAALLKHKHVTIRILKGNHDEDSSVAIVYFLLAWYRNEPRVTVDADPSDYFWFRFGKVLLGATHGHQSSNHIAKMPGIMAHRRAEDWGVTKFRYVHGFHLHHSAKFATEGDGVISEIHQAPVPQDAWHFGSGFLSGRSLQAITYHKDFGEIGRVRTAILDGEVQ